MLLARFGRFCQLLLRIWRWSRQTSCISGRCGVRISVRGKVQRINATFFRARVDGGSPLAARISAIEQLNCEAQKRLHVGAFSVNGAHIHT